MLRKENYLYGPDDVTVPVIANFGDYFVKCLLGYGDRDAFINGATDSKLTFKQIAQQGLGIASPLLFNLLFQPATEDGMNLAVSLYYMGVRKGDTIAICSDNRYEYWGALVGVVCVGAVFTPYNPGYTAVEMQHVLSISKPKYIFCSPKAFELHETIFRSVVKKIIVFGDENRNNTLSFNDLVTPVISNEKSVFINNRLTRNIRIEEFLTVDVDQNDLVFVLYSSGTTGMHKGVILTHYNIITACCSKAAKFTGNRILSIVPWFHALGLNGCLICLSSGKTFVILHKFEVDLYLKIIEKYKVEQLQMVPPILVAISQTSTNYDLSSVKKIVCGSAPVFKETLDAIRQKFPNSPGVLEGYGCTETTIVTSVNDYVDGKLLKPGSVGTVAPCTTVKVIDIHTRKVLGPKREGEICVKGLMVMRGYVRKDKREDFDEEGFFRTGDIGYYDEDGYLFIIDRLKELIKYKGYQVAPAEIEAVLLQHPAVKDVGVVGIHDRNAGEVPLAFVVTQLGKSVSQKELQDFVAQNLSNPKHLRGGVRFVQTIPKNPSGKIVRKVLRVMATCGKSKL